MQRYFRELRDGILALAEYTTACAGKLPLLGNASSTHAQCANPAPQQSCRKISLVNPRKTVDLEKIRLPVSARVCLRL
ncbi:MAG: hypothetical protein QM665_03305 [Desulfovibrio sp.]